ncbi:hypothetical protein [Longibaculum muris]|uniref:hypothetical protein n=1 Tax=Longibaculum muris TaxID=1796628 RepID=UPI00189DC902|nr:hypothetical protein [Longibaculum muris]
MNIKIKIKEKQQLLFIALGSVIGFLLSNYMELDTVQTLQESTRILGEELSVQSASDLIHFQMTAALYGPILFRII